MKSGDRNFLEPSGPFQTCNGTDLPFTALSRNFLKEILRTFYGLILLNSTLVSSFGYSRQFGLDNCCFPFMNMFIPFVLSNKNKIFFKNWLARPRRKEATATKH